MTFRQWLQLKFQHIRFSFQFVSFEFELRRLIKEVAEKAGVKIEEAEARNLLTTGFWLGFASGLVTGEPYVSRTPLWLKVQVMQLIGGIQVSRSSKISPEAQALRSAREQLIKSGAATVVGGGPYKRSAVLRLWLGRIITFLQYLFLRRLKPIIIFLRGFYFSNEQSKKEGMLIFCKDFDKSVQNARNKKPINARAVSVIIEPMETEIHGASEFWKFPAIGEQTSKEEKARGYTLIGALLISDQVWLRVIKDDFEFDVARQICEQATFGYLNVKREVDRR
jgi:hypothetical protein